jgi:hypothetical protein
MNEVTDLIGWLYREHSPTFRRKLSRLKAGLVLPHRRYKPPKKWYVIQVYPTYKRSVPSAKPDGYLGSCPYFENVRVYKDVRRAYRFRNKKPAQIRAEAIQEETKRFTEVVGIPKS